MRDGDVILTPDGKLRTWKTGIVSNNLSWEGSFNGKVRDGYSRWFYAYDRETISKPPMFCEGHCVNGQHSGHWKFYNQDGSIKREKIYII